MENKNQLTQEIQSLLGEAQKELEERRESGGEVSDEHYVQITQNGGFSLNLPDDMSEEYGKKMQDAMMEIDRTLEKEEDVDFDPLSADELKSYDLLNGETLRVFSPIIDVGGGRQEEESGDEETE